MIKEFNTYLKKVDANYWNAFFKEKGTLRMFKAGEVIIYQGKTGTFVGLIKSGSVKYSTINSYGDEKIIGLETTDGFAASWPFSYADNPLPYILRQ